jgi:putative transposase
MLKPEEWLQLCQKLKLSEESQKIAEAIRTSPPTRRVRSSAGNVSVRYPSRKMGVVIQAESHRNELAGVYEKEYDSNTLEYYDQPPSIKLVYVARNGRIVNVKHTPDYFVIRKDEIGWEEWKTEEELERLKETMPNRYIKRTNGHWYCPPGDEAAQPFGFFYRVRSSHEIHWILQRNLLFLEDYLHNDCPVVHEQYTAEITRLVADVSGINLKLLMQKVVDSEKGITCDHIYTMIAAGQLYADLRASPLAEPERVSIFRCFEEAHAHSLIRLHPVERIDLQANCVVLNVGVQILWDGRLWHVVNVGVEQTALLSIQGDLVQLPNLTIETLVQQQKITQAIPALKTDSSSQVMDMLSQASLEDFKEANRRYEIIAPRLAGLISNSFAIPTRTIRSWVSLWRQAERQHSCGYIGLLPQRQNSGNRTAKLSESAQALMEKFIAEDYENLRQKPRLEVYGALVRACQKENTPSPSYKTFALAIKRQPKQEQIRKRQGKRSAYQVSPFYFELSLTTPRHGDRPFEITHLDHTELDIELVCSRTGRNLGRPWATFLSDAFSRRLLAVYVAFDPPSYRACMMTLRECVRRYGRFPQTIVVDGGKEFEGVYFETLLARYECTKKSRPGASPRFGSICERLFGTANSRFIHNLVGNTQITKNVRQVTQSVAPQNLASWSLGVLYTRLCEWAYDVYDTIEHPALAQSPREAYLAGINQSGMRSHRLIPYDDTLHILTLPTTKKGSAQILPRLGVKIRYIHYWADIFLDSDVQGKRVPVRFDPFDAGVAYAFVKGRWVRCISEHYAWFAGRSEQEMMMATAELHKRNRQHNQQMTITACKLADFLVSVESDEVLLEQRMRDKEAKDILGQINRTSQTQSESSPKEAKLFSKAESHETDHNLDIYEDY